MPETSRLDVALVERGLARSRTRARELVEAGEVRVAGATATKTSQQVGPDTLVEVTTGADHWVGRAAGKLLGALDAFDVAVPGRRCIDIGACTGGFTQVLLEHGAEHVVALDVGHDQLAPELVADDRVDEAGGQGGQPEQHQDLGRRVTHPVVLSTASRPRETMRPGGCPRSLRLPGS